MNLGISRPIGGDIKPVDGDIKPENVEKDLGYIDGGSILVGDGGTEI